MKQFLVMADRLITLLLAVTMVLLLVPVTLQIVSRYTDLIPRYMWTEEMSRFFFIWLIMLGATLGVRNRMHFDVDFLPALSPAQNKFLTRLSQLFMLLFSGVIFYWGIDFTQFGWNQTSELASMPMWWIFIAWPLSAFFWILFLTEHILVGDKGNEGTNQGSVV